MDLLGGFGDDIIGGENTDANAFATDKALPALSMQPAVAAPADDDEFADFQVAPTSAPAAAPAKPNLMEMLKSAPTSHAYRPSVSATSPNNNLFGMLSPTTTAQPTYTNQNQTSLFGGGTSSPLMRPSTMSPTAAPIGTSSTAAMAPTMAGLTTNKATTKSSSSNFDDLWSMSLGSSTVNKPASVAAATGANKSIKDLEKEKAQAGIWGSVQRSQAGGMAFGNFGSGSFGGSGATPSAGGGDDLLL